MSTPNKRPLNSESASAKRGRVEHIARLCDLRAGADLFADERNAAKAKERGILRSRNGEAKYEEVRQRLRRTHTRPARQIRILRENTEPARVSPLGKPSSSASSSRCSRSRASSTSRTRTGCLTCCPS